MSKDRIDETNVSTKLQTKNSRRNSSLSEKRSNFNNQNSNNQSEVDSQDDFIITPSHNFPESSNNVNSHQITGNDFSSAMSNNHKHKKKDPNSNTTKKKFKVRSHVKRRRSAIH